MTAYDHWKTSAPEQDDEAWNDSVGQVAYELAGSTAELEELVSILANADDALNWICGAITVPDNRIHAFRDLVIRVSGMRSKVEKEMKEYHDARD